MKSYLNTKINSERETVDELNSSEFETTEAYKAEKKRLISEYHLAGGFGDLYWSQRPCANWKK